MRVNKIKNIIKKYDVNEFEKVIENENKYFFEIFDYLSEELVNKNMSEYLFIKFIDVLINKGYDMYNKNNIKYIKNYKHNNVYNAYKFTLICYIKCKIEKILNKYLIKLKKLNRKNYKELLELNNIREIIDNKKVINDVIKYLNSYKNKFNKKMNIEDDIYNSEILIKMNFKNENLMKYDGERLEILDRLLYLTKNFGLEFMWSLGIELKTNKDIEYIEFNSLVNYYNRVITNLSNFFINLENNIIKYVEISNLYNKIKLIKNILINVSRYEGILSENIEK